MLQRDHDQLSAKAQDLFDQGDFSGARKLYEAICTQNKTHRARDWIQLGVIHEKLGNLLESKNCLEKALSMEPNMAEAHFQLGRINYLLFQLKDSVACLSKAVTFKSNHIQSWLLLGKIYHQTGKTANAEKCLRNVLALQPNLPEAYTSLSEILLAAGRSQEAMETSRQAVGLCPDNATAWTLLGNAALESGDMNEARAAARRALDIDPGQAQAWFILGSSQLSDTPEEALQCFGRALEINPRHADTLAKLGMLEHSRGNLALAQEYYQKSIKVNPNEPVRVFNLGVILMEMGKAREAEYHFRNAIKLKPDYTKAYINLGYLLRTTGKPEEACEYYRQALRLEPDSAEFHYDHGLALQRAGYLDAAAGCYSKALQLKPDYFAPCLQIAGLQLGNGEYTAAESSFKKAISIKPESHDAHRGLGVALISQGRQADAVPCFENALKIKPDFTDALAGLGAALVSLQRPEDALACSKKMLAIKPDDPDAVALTATIYQHMGDTQEAYECLSPLLDKGIGHINVLLAFSGLCRRLHREEEATLLMEKMLTENSLLSASCRRSLHFNLGKLYDSMHKYDQAFEHYRQGNELKHASFDPDAHARDIDLMIQMHTYNAMKTLPHASVRSRKPVFIVGMPRSGTSLVEQILASHPAVHGAGELVNIIRTATTLHQRLRTATQYPSCLQELTQDSVDRLAMEYLDYIESLSPESNRITDKMPGNFMHLGLIELLFPDAYIIHCKRDPLDTCLSGYFQDFSRSHPYSYDLSNLAAFYTGYNRLMKHWKNVLNIPIFEVEYENLVKNQEEMSRRLLDFCELEWSDQCLKFHETKRFVGTASYDQVNQPMYERSVQRWRNYEKHLDALKTVLQQSPES